MRNEIVDLVTSTAAGAEATAGAGEVAAVEVGAKATAFARAIAAVVPVASHAAAAACATAAAGATAGHTATTGCAMATAPVARPAAAAVGGDDELLSPSAQHLVDGGDVDVNTVGELLSGLEGRELDYHAFARDTPKGRLGLWKRGVPLLYKLGTACCLSSWP